MKGRSVGKQLLLFCVLLFCLLGESLRESNGGLAAWIGLVLGPLTGAVAQWTFFFIIVIYLIILKAFAHQFVSGFEATTNKPVIWLALLCLVNVMAYVLHYSRASQSTEALTLMGGIMLGQGGVAWCLWKEQEGKQEGNGRRNVAVMLTVILLASLFCPTILKSGFAYRQEMRWAGLWDNPNTFGLLIGVGVVLALGLAAGDICLKFQDRPGTSSEARSADGWKWFEIAFYLVAAGMMSFGLFKSYSRGSVVSVVCGMIYFCIFSAIGSHVRSRRWRRFFLYAVVAGCALATLAFWHFRNTENPVAQRVFSICNTNDFSWRNRIVAWEGALKIMADHFWQGAGWNNPVPLYEHYYLPQKLEDGAAIGMNDYLLLGATLGMPALLCFGIYLWLSLTRHPNHVTDACEMERIDRLKIMCRAAAVVLLAGFWFDGGLFKLATASTFWILLELGNVENYKVNGTMIVPPENNDTCLPALQIILRFFGRRVQRVLREFLWPLTRAFPLLIILLFAGALFWAKLKDPFFRNWFELKTPDCGALKCVAIMPKPMHQYPVVIYAHGRGDNLIQDGNDLRQMAELGLAAISLEYDQTNKETFAVQLKAVLDYLRLQKWADTNKIAWVGSSLGANLMFDFCIHHPEEQPRLFVQLSGAGLSGNQPNNRWNSIHCSFLLVHGEQDQIFPEVDTKRLALALQSGGRAVEMGIISNLPHDMTPERQVVFRYIGEYCITQLSSHDYWQSYHSVAQWQAESPSLILFWLPAAAWAGGWYLWKRRIKPAQTEKVPLRRHEIALRWLAVVLAVWALTETGLHLIPPHFAVSNRTLALARKFSVRPKERSGFEELASRPIWNGQKLQTLLDHVELAGYNRELINWHLDDTMYRDQVLSPIITGEAGEQLNWRRSLWEEFYPRIRHESSPADAAGIVVRHLRERVTMVEMPNLPHAVPEIWLRQLTDKAGFQIIYVAALRSVGVPARLDAKGQAEFYDGEKWIEAPKPVIYEAIGDG